MIIFLGHLCPGSYQPFFVITLKKLQITVDFCDHHTITQSCDLPCCCLLGLCIAMPQYQIFWQCNALSSSPLFYLNTSHIVPCRMNPRRRLIEPGGRMSNSGKSDHPPCLHLAFCITRDTKQTGTLPPSTTSMHAPVSSQLYPPFPPPATFKFTKRKHWADLLITELAEAIILILSTQCQILYCSAVVEELLRWRNEDLIDAKFLDLVNSVCMCPALRVLSFSAHC